MNVLYVYKDYFPVLGGIENHVKYLAEGLVARGASVTVLVTNTGSKTVIEEQDGVQIIKAGRLGSISSAPVSADLFRWIGRQRPDIAHLHFPYPVGEMAYLLRGRGRKSRRRPRRREPSPASERRKSHGAARSALLAFRPANRFKDGRLEARQSSRRWHRTR